MIWFSPQEIATPTLFSPFSYHAGNSLLKWVGISPGFLGTTVMTSRGIIFEYHSYHVLEFRHALSYLCCQLFGWRVIRLVKGWMVSITVVWLCFPLLPCNMFSHSNVRRLTLAYAVDGWPSGSLSPVPLTWCCLVKMKAYSVSVGGSHDPHEVLV